MPATRITCPPALPATRLLLVGLVGLALAAPLCPQHARAMGTDGNQVLPKAGHPSLESPHVSPILALNGRVFVTNTPAGTVDVITPGRGVTRRVQVGVDPVSLAARPDGKEIWVSNHVSDSVSVIDTDTDSPSFLRVVATLQDLDHARAVTRFDEPAGIAFADCAKAYVALSSSNQIAVVDVASRKVTGRIAIPAQEPRAIAVAAGRLFVLPFESGNQTQLSGGVGAKDGDLVTFDAYEHSIRVNNVLSIGHVTDIVRNPAVPDRDLFLFRTSDDSLDRVVSSLGTLLYGLAVDGQGNAFITQTEARNDANGRAGSKKHGLRELGNRPFLNRVTMVPANGDKPRTIELEPLPPQNPAPGEALATPFGLQVLDNGMLVGTAAGSDLLFTLDPASQKVLGRVTVGAGPRGVTIANAPGQPARAWVYNALDNSVEEVDLSRPESPRALGRVALEDPTHPASKRGRIAFNTASASTTATFSCASCHPDGHTDQLLWVLDTPVVTGGNQIMPRSTMPARGLRDTAPFHWDGIPGDPYGGINSASIHTPVSANASPADQRTSTRHLVDGGLASTMALPGDPAANSEGKKGRLDAAARDDMALYLLGVPYPPAPGRPYTDLVSSAALEGFRLFHIDGDHDPKQARPNVCGNCHRMPFLVSTNTPGTGMDAPTFRGAQDRWLILPQGRLNIIAFDFYRKVAEAGHPERELWRHSWAQRRRFDPVWDMVLEMSTGFSGAFARQVQLDRATSADTGSVRLISALEKAARDGTIVLQADGHSMVDGKLTDHRLQFEPASGNYLPVAPGDPVPGGPITRERLLQLATAGSFTGFLTARHGQAATLDNPQPALWTRGAIERQRGRQVFPILHPGDRTMHLSGRHFDATARVLVDGTRAGATFQAGPAESVDITLDSLPPPGMHLVQVQMPGGLLGNELIFHVAPDAEAAKKLRRDIDRPHLGFADKVSTAVVLGDADELEKLLDSGAPADAPSGDARETPLHLAALRGETAMARLLLGKGAPVSAANRDGNTPLHLAAFFCRPDTVRLLLEKGADPSLKNKRGETPLDVVRTKWSPGLESLYTRVDAEQSLGLDIPSLPGRRATLLITLEKAVK